MNSLRKDVARNRAQILAAAARLHAQGEPLQLNGVAREADVGVGTVYRHFATVAELEEALALPRFAQIEELANESADLGIGQLLTKAFDVLLADDLFAEAATRATLTLPEAAQARSSLINALSRRLEQSRTAGEISDSLTATEILALMCGLAHAVRSTGKTTHPAAMLQVILKGLGAAPGPDGAVTTQSLAGRQGSTVVAPNGDDARGSHLPYA